MFVDILPGLSATTLIALLKPSVNMMVATALPCLTLQAGCRGYLNVESGRHVRELNRTVLNHHTVDTNFRGDIITISHHVGVGHDSVDSYRFTIHIGREERLPVRRRWR